VTARALDALSRAAEAETLRQRYKLSDPALDRAMG